MTAILRLLGVLAIAMFTTAGGAPAPELAARKGRGLHFGHRAKPTYCGIGHDDIGRRVSVFSDGRLMPILFGAAEGDPPPPGTPPGSPPGTPPTAHPDLSGLQAALDAAKTEGERAALQTAVKALGFEKLEDAQKWVDEKRAADLAAMDEVQRREKAAEDREKAANEREAAANAKAQRADIRAALLDAGAPKELVGDLVDIIKVPADADEAAIKAAVEAKKAAAPAFFAAAGTPPPANPPAPSGLPGGTPPPGTPPADPLEAGKQRAAAIKAGRAGATQKDLIDQFTPRPSPLAPTH